MFAEKNKSVSNERKCYQPTYFTLNKDGFFQHFYKCTILHLGHKKLSGGTESITELRTRDVSCFFLAYLFVFCVAKSCYQTMLTHHTQKKVQLTLTAYNKSNFTLKLEQKQQRVLHSFATTLRPCIDCLSRCTVSMLLPNMQNASRQFKFAQFCQSNLHLLWLIKGYSIYLNLLPIKYTTLAQ